MILTLKYSGLFLRNCNIFQNDKLYASLTQNLIDSKAFAVCGTSDWIIKEKKSEKQIVQVFEHTFDHPVAETNPDLKDETFKDTDKIGSSVASVVISGDKYALLAKKDAPSQYIWIKPDGLELIHYDVTNLENVSKNYLKFSCYSMSYIPDSPEKSEIILMFLGVYLLRRHSLKR